MTLDTESFHGDYVVTGITDSVNEKEANTCAIILSNAALTEWNGFDPAGYRAYVHFKNSDQLGEELMTSYCREIDVYKRQDLRPPSDRPYLLTGNGSCRTRDKKFHKSCDNDRAAGPFNV